MNVKKLLVPVLLVLSLAGCTPSLNLQVALPKLTGSGFTVALETSATTGLAPLTVEFNADARESATYAWYVNDRKLARERGVLTYTFEQAGSYEVTVAATNAVGETDTETITVEATGAEGDPPAVDSL